MKKILAFLLAALMVMSFAACSQSQENPTEAPTEAPTDAPTEAPTDAPVAGKEISFFMISINDANGAVSYLMAYPNEDGTAYLDIFSDVVKRGNVDGAALAAISQAFDASGLSELESSPDDAYSADNASISITYTDDTSVNINLYGELPEAFNTGYAAMLNSFNEAAAELPEYVAKPMENGEIAESDRVALDGILENLELFGPADSFGITGFAKDEYFAASMHLASDEGVASGLQFAPMMTSNAYALMIVTLEEGADAQAVAGNFENGIDWLRWVCVQPESAFIAVKDNQVLMVLGGGEFHDATVAATEAAGWTEFKTLANPNM